MKFLMTLLLATSASTFAFANGMMSNVDTITCDFTGKKFDAYEFILTQHYDQHLLTVRNRMTNDRIETIQIMDLVFNDDENGWINGHVWGFRSVDGKSSVIITVPTKSPKSGIHKASGFTRIDWGASFIISESEIPCTVVLR